VGKIFFLPTNLYVATQIFFLPTLQINAIKLSQGEHAGFEANVF
jgi:hypothetical protein